MGTVKTIAYSITHSLNHLPMHLLLIRHAESETNIKSHLVGGQINEARLTDKGIKQATALGKRWQEEKRVFAKVHSSVAVRAAHTCQIACNAIGIDLDSIQYTDTLVEISQGEWTGKLRNEVYTPETIAIINEDAWHFKPLQGESQREVEERVWAYLETNIFSKTWKEQDVVAVFAHGIVIKTVIKHFLDSLPAMTWRINIQNTAMTAFHLTEKGWFLEYINDFSHLNTAY